MAITPDLVRGAIKVNANIDLTMFIRTAGRLVAYIVSKDTAGLLTSDLAQELEVYLACFYCALKYPQYASKSVADASGQFQTGQRGQGYFQQNDWGVAAIGLDVTGELAKLNKGIAQIQFGWLGTPVLSQTPWWERDGNASGN